MPLKEGPKGGSSEQPALKKARVENCATSGIFSPSPGAQSYKAPQANTPRLDASGWIQLGTPSPTAAHAQVVSERGIQEQQRAGKATHAASFEGFIFESPLPNTAPHQDFSTVEIRRELSRIQSQSQSLQATQPCGLEGEANTVRLANTSRTHLTWPETCQGQPLLGSSTAESADFYYSPVVQTRYYEGQFYPDREGPQHMDVTYSSPADDTSATTQKTFPFREGSQHEELSDSGLGEWTIAPAKQTHPFGEARQCTDLCPTSAAWTEALVGVGTQLAKEGSQHVNLPDGGPRDQITASDALTNPARAVAQHTDSTSELNSKPRIQLAPGFALAADFEAVKRQQAEKPSCKLLRKLTDWGVPVNVAAVYESKGLKELYPWQAAALESGAAGNNLIYCAPTSGGKTVVAEVLMIRKLLATALPAKPPHRRRFLKALVVLPFVALVQEKTEHLSKALAGMHCKVKGYAGSEDSSNSMPLSERGEAVAVCTIEKANVAINRLLQQARIHQLCCIVVDELHMITDEHRGLALELSLTKLLHADQGNLQIIGMSATIGGLEGLAKWMRASLFITNYRPVPLTEHVVFDGEVFVKGKSENSSAPVKALRSLPESTPRDRDRLVPLVAETLEEGGSVLVFCGGRGQTQTGATLILDHLEEFAITKTEEAVQSRREALVQEMRDALGQGSSPLLEKLILRGVAYHHAGMCKEERAVVEQGFRSGEIKVLTATSTLAAGINLPAKRVILRSLRQGPANVSRSQYLQMVGRAGRAGQAQSGESFLLGSGEPFSAAGEWKAVCTLLEAPLPHLTSQLLATSCVTNPEGTQQLQRLFLECVSNGTLGMGKRTLTSLLDSTLLTHQRNCESIQTAAKAALQALRDLKLLTFRQSEEGKGAQWVPTEMGRAVFESSMLTQQGVVLYTGLSELCRSELAVQDQAQLIFLIVQEHPFRITNWSIWQCIFSKLPQAKQRIASLLGVKEGYILRRCGGGRSEQAVNARHEKFIATLVLQQLVAGTSPAALPQGWTTANGLGQKGIDNGELQRLQGSLSKWAAMAAMMCASAGWWQLEVLLSLISAQAAAGAQTELLPLLKVEAITAAKAKMLYAAGLTNLGRLAASDEDTVAQALAAGIRNRTSKGDPHAALKIGKTGAQGTNALIARDAKHILHEVRQYQQEQLKEYHRIWLENQLDE